MDWGELIGRLQKSGPGDLYDYLAQKFAAAQPPPSYNPSYDEAMKHQLSTPPAGSAAPSPVAPPTPGPAVIGPPGFAPNPSSPNIWKLIEQLRDQHDTGTINPNEGDQLKGLDRGASIQSPQQVALMNEAYRNMLKQYTG